MIRFLLTGAHRYTLESVRKYCPNPQVELLHYENLHRIKRLRRATYVFSDLDRLSQGQLEEANRLYLQLSHLGMVVLNNPAVVKRRYSLLRALFKAGLNDFNVFRATELPTEIKYPVFVRKDYGHGSPLGGLLHSRAALDDMVRRAEAGGISAENLIVIEYAGEPVRAGQYRKWAAFRIGSAIVPHFGVNDTQWLVKMGSGIGVTDDLYDEEFTMLQTNPYAEHLRRAFEIAQIEYGRADFGFYRGKIQIFEINLNPTIPLPGVHPSPVRVESMKLAWQKYLEGLRNIDSTSKGSVRLLERDLPPEVLTILNHDSQRGKRGRSRAEQVQAMKWKALRLFHKLQNSMGG